MPVLQQSDNLLNSLPGWLEKRVRNEMKREKKPNNRKRVKGDRAANNHSSARLHVENGESADTLDMSRQSQGILISCGATTLFWEEMKASGYKSHLYITPVSFLMATDLQ